MLSFIKEIFEYLGFTRSKETKMDEGNIDPHHEDFQSMESSERFINTFFLMISCSEAIINLDDKPELSDTVKHYIDINLFQFPIDSEDYLYVTDLIYRTVIRASYNLEDASTRDYQILDKIAALYASQKSPFNKYIEEKRKEILANQEACSEDSPNNLNS